MTTPRGGDRLDDIAEPAGAAVASLDIEGIPIDTRSIEKLEDAIARDDLDAASAVVRESWFDLLHVYGPRVRAALSPVAASALRERPLLTMLLGISYILGGHRRMKALRLFTGAVRATRSSKRQLDSAESVLILTSEAAAYRLIGRPSMGVAPARSAVELLESMSDASRERVSQLPRVYSQLGISLYYGGAVEDALEVFEKGLAISPERAPSPGFGNVAMLAGVHALRGDLHEAEHYVRIARSGTWNDTQRSMYTGTFYRLAEALLALERFDAETAESHVRIMFHDRRTIEHWVAIAQVEALVGLVAGHPGAALSRLDAFALSRGAEGRSSATRAALAPIRAVLQLAIGSPEAAGPLLMRDDTPGPHRHVRLARVELAFGRTGSALGHLRAAAGADLSARAQASAAALEAAVALRISSKQAGAAVERLAGLLEHTGQRLAVALLPAEDAERVRAALDAAGYEHLFAGLEPPRLVLGVESGRLLTDREMHVLRSLTRSGSLPEIAAEQSVSVNTIKTQLKSIYRKLGASNREEAVAIALDRHLVAPEDGMGDV